MAYLSTALVLLGLFSFLLFTPTTISAQTVPGTGKPVADDDPDIVDPTQVSFVRGDLDGNLQLDLGDVLSSLNALFQDSTIQCEDANDCNDDGLLDISDPITLLAYLFGGGESLPAPGSSGCGTDETRDTLSCEKSVCP